MLYGTFNSKVEIPVFVLCEFDDGCFQFLKQTTDQHRSRLLLRRAFALFLLGAQLIGEVRVDEFLPRFQSLGVDLHRNCPWLARIQERSLADEWRRRDRELLGDVVQNAARLDNVRLFVQGALLCKTELLQALEAPLHVPELVPHDVEDLCVSLVEAGLLVARGLRDGGQYVFGQVVAFPTCKEETRLR